MNFCDFFKYVARLKMEGERLYVHVHGYGTCTL